METTKKSSKKAEGATAAKIKDAYVEYLLTHGTAPASVFKFCMDLGIKEEAFYGFYGSFEAIEKDCWTGFITKAISRLTADEAFATFTSREKILSLYFTLLEELKHNRSFVVQQMKPVRKLELVPSFLTGFKKAFEEFIEKALLQGKANGEIAQRPYIEKVYPQLWWMHMGFVLMFWKEDDSTGFEKTDAAVEKSVNLAFDLIGKGAVDSALDFAKFLYQSKK